MGFAPAYRRSYPLPPFLCRSLHHFFFLFFFYLLSCWASNIYWFKVEVHSPNWDCWRDGDGEGRGRDGAQVRGEGEENGSKNSTPGGVRGWFIWRHFSTHVWPLLQLTPPPIRGCTWQMLNPREGRVCSLVSAVFVCRDLANSNCLLWYSVISGSFVAAVFWASSVCSWSLEIAQKTVWVKQFLSG